MSETILEHGYVPEEHAPDPVVSHGDPTAPGKIGIWLFLASEIMFFVAILGSYVIYRSGSPQLFAKNAETLNKVLADKEMLTAILTEHVVGQRLGPDAVAGEFDTLNPKQGVTVEGSGEDFTVNGSAKVLCGNVQTANATVYIIDTVLLPKS